MAKLNRLLLLLFAVPLPTRAEAPPPPCTQPAQRQFDFWVGQWYVQWKDPQGKTAGGTNTIRKTLGDCVIVEEFDGGTGSPLKGMSVSTYDTKAQRWKQTWVDNTGAYLDFVGGYADGRMTLSRQSTAADGKVVHQRMVFREIKADSLTWDWEKSEDGGQTWKLAWRIEYMRRK